MSGFIGKIVKLHVRNMQVTIIKKASSFLITFDIVMTILKVRPTFLMRTRSVICSIKNIMLLKQGIITVCRLNQNSKKKLSWSKRNVKQQFKKCHVTLSIIYHYFCDTYETFGSLKFLFFLKLKFF